MVKVIEIQNTPNPDAFKFVVDAKIVAQGAKSYEDRFMAKDDPLALALFDLKGISSVFMMDRFVTVTKTPLTQWSTLEREITSLIETKAAPVVEEKKAAFDPAAPAVAGTESKEDVLQKINQVLDDNVRPALAGDGGGLEVIDYTDKVLTVHYQGACGSCPSSTTGTLFAIQNLLQRMIDPEIQVVSDM
jgi:Fe-S cluster biogenesis protein NfuA